MELRQLEYFLAVAEEASFTRAAGRVHVAQPGISAQVRALERELGQTLLDRSGRQVTLTEVGAAVLPYARAALEAVAGVRDAVEGLDALTRGRVHVGIVAASGAFGVADLLARFHSAHPAIEISLREDESTQLLRGLAEGWLDLALVGVSGQVSTALRRVGRQVIVEDRLMAGVYPGHALANRRTVSLRSVVAHPLICVPPGTGMRKALQDGCAAIGVEPVIALEAADPLVVAQLAARGLGVAILPESSAGIEPALHMAAISRPQLRSRVELAWRTEGSVGPAARAMIATAREFFDAPPDSPSASA